MKNPGHENAPPDSWAKDAATLPLAFAQVREDPTLDLALLRLHPDPTRIAMIASGGDTALCFAPLPLRELFLVDMNAAQLALTKLKWHLAHHAGQSETLRLLGHLPQSPAERKARLRELMQRLEIEETAWGPMDDLAEHGPDHAGRYEALFTELRRRLSPQRQALDALLQSTDPALASKMAAPGTPLGRALDEAFASVLSLPNLVCLFGSEATQNPRQAFHAHFLERLRGLLARMPAANPWLLLAGVFPDGHPAPWMALPQSALRFSPVYHHGEMRAFLEARPPRSLDMIHLSNILDWLAVPEAAATLQTAARALAAGGLLIIRQLNSTLDISALSDDFAWQSELGREMERSDRSFFYRDIHVGIKQAP